MCRSVLGQETERGTHAASDSSKKLLINLMKFLAKQGERRDTMEGEKTILAKKKEKTLTYESDEYTLLYYAPGSVVDRDILVRIRIRTTDLRIWIRIRLRILFFR
jgi:hypothetical protein